MFDSQFAPYQPLQFEAWHPPGYGLATFGFRGNTNYDGVGSVTSWDMAKPAGVVDGDFLLMFISQANPETPSTVPTGFTNIQTSVADHGGANCLTYYKIASGEGSTWTWGYTTGKETSACLIALIGGTYDTIGQTEDGTGSTAPSAPSITVANSGSILIAANGAKDTNYTGTPSGFTEVMNVTTNQNLWLGYKTGVASGASGTAAWTYDTSKKNDSILVSVGP